MFLFQDWVKKYIFYFFFTGILKKYAKNDFLVKNLYHYKK